MSKFSVVICRVAYKSLQSSIKAPKNVFWKSIPERYASSNQRRTEYVVQPFWKLKAAVHNVALELKSDGLEKIVTSSEASDNAINFTENERDKTLEFSITASVPNTPVSISVPYQSDLDIVLSGSGKAHIKDVENKATLIAADNYDIQTQDIRSNDIQVILENGDIICRKNIKGNVLLRTSKGNISTDKIQGNTVSATSTKGSVTMGDVYAMDISVIAEREIRMQNVHGDCEIETQDHIAIGTAEGRINAISEHGNIQVYLTDNVEHADIVTNTGNIALFFSDGLSGQLDVEAQSIHDLGAKSCLKEVRQRQQGPCLRYRGIYTAIDFKLSSR